MKKKLAEILEEMGFIDADQMRGLLPLAEEAGKKLGTLLLEKGVVTDVQLAQALAAQRGMRYLDLTGFRISPVFFESIPVDIMYRYQFVPCEEKDGRLIVAIADPGDLFRMDELEVLLEMPVDFVVSTAREIGETLKRSEGTQAILKEVSEDFVIGAAAEDEETVLAEDLIKGTSPIIKLVDTIVLNAIQKRASDIHIEATDKGVIVKYRIDGVLYNAMDPIDSQHHRTIVSRIKVMSELDIAETRIPQDGRFKVRLKNKGIDCRVSILPSVFGEDVVIRILDKEYLMTEFAQLKLEPLGFDEEDLRKFRKSILEPYGMVLVTGPTGSGKTTTLYAAISEIYTDEDKIITIEDPVEYQLRGILQIPVNEKKGLTFARGLRSILRHDPDKIMVGEIRDPETAQIAVQSALTGHLVFTTVHANNAFDVIGRFTNMGIEPYNFVSCLNCILAQRLVRSICLNCKTTVEHPEQVFVDAGLDYNNYRDHPFYEGKGCVECNWTGYKGRQAITEFLDLSDRIRELILDKRPSSEIRRIAVEEGMTSLRASAVRKVLAGITTIKEINRVTFVE
ncbi:MAG: ATPase, T2SS/T4P/T4SS family [Nitrospirota bacterium]|nr:ATPase, T2SS/T4P/T4SS family [Nitrospirota bacterium]